MSKQTNIEPIANSNATVPATSDYRGGHNALLVGAAKLLAQSTQLRKGSSGMPLPALQAHLIQLIENFMRDGQSMHYPAPILLASRYFLCATLDELISNAAWIEEQAWDTLSLLGFFKQEPRDSDRFYLILQRACENPKEHVDLIELGFHCLSMGFMGEYKNKTKGSELITKLMDKLYQIIIDTRGEASKTLFLGQTPFVKIKTKRLSWSCNKRWAGIIWGACIVIFLAVLIPYKSKLSTLTDPIQQELTTLAQKKT